MCINDTFPRDQLRKIHNTAAFFHYLANGRLYFRHCAKETWGLFIIVLGVGNTRRIVFVVLRTFSTDSTFKEIFITNSASFPRIISKQ